jgi:hypothetical protein
MPLKIGFLVALRKMPLNMVILGGAFQSDTKNPILSGALKSATKNPILSGTV